MISKNEIKLIKQLEQKKHRQREGLFVAEGPKVVGDLLRHGYSPARIFATEECSLSLDDVCKVTSDELRRISFLQHPQQVLAVFRLPNKSQLSTLNSQPSTLNPQPSITLALDAIQDPGNLGTIIRVADWFGISNIVCSLDTADTWSPKVVQATMGSIARVNIYYTDLPAFLSQCQLPVCGTVLDGDNIFTADLPREAVLVMGNEGNGISPKVRSLLTHRLLIPPAPRENHSDGPESLNVAIATAIACAEFARTK